MIVPMIACLAALLQPPTAADGPERYQPGVTMRLFQLEGDGLRAIPRLKDGQTPNVDEARPTIDWRASDFPSVAAPFYTQAIGRLDVVAEGAYTFRLTSDDGSRLTIDGSVVIDHDGRHGASSKTGEPLVLAPGPHRLLVEHFDAAGDRVLRLEWRRPDRAEFEVVPSERLRTEVDHARVVAPGVKRLLEARRPGDGTPVAGVHPSFRLDTIEVEGFTPMVGCMAFASDGRLIVGTFNPLQRDDVKLPDIESKPPDKLYALEGVLGDVAKVTARPCADGLFEPSGLCAVGDVLYVSHRRAITRLIDRDGDGFYETHQDVAKGWAAWNYHQFTFGLVHRPDPAGGPGWLYACLSTAMAPPKWEGMGTNAAPNDPLRGSVIEVDLASDTYRAIAGGVRAPNGIGWGPRGQDGEPALFYTDNQGTWMPSGHLGEVVPGRFFGHYNNDNFVPNLAERFPHGGIASVWCDRVRATPAVDLVYGDISNSPTQPVLIESGPYRNQLLIGELTAGGLRRACLEQVNGQWQGAVFQFSQGFNVGINRVAWDPAGSGALVVGGIGAGGNWNWKEKRWGLQRLTPTGVMPFEVSAIRAMPDGFDVQFTRDVDRAWLADPAHYTVKQWTYEPTDRYGGEKQQIESLTVAEARPTEGAVSRRVFLKVPGLKERRTVLIRTDPTSVEGEPVWATESFYTLNCIPRVWSSGPPWPEPFRIGAMPPRDATVLIGRSARAAFSTPSERSGDVETGRTQKEITGGVWEAFTDVGQGDLLSRASLGDCRLHVEWLSPAGGEGQMAGNSGVYVQDRYEVQVLGTLPGSAPLQSNEAGSIYGVRPPDVNASTGPGTWQAYDILFTAPRFLGGAKVSNARLTLYWNGVLVHRDAEISGPTGSAAAKGESADGRADGVQIGPVRLQAHATAAEGPVRYRNVWVAPLHSPYERARHGGWLNLLGSGNLDAFVVRGGAATYRLENGELIGTTAQNSPNTFLVTKDSFGDFELLADVKVDPALNSGIQVRSDVEGRTDPTPIEQTPRDGRIRGYQVEIDPSPRAYTAGVYDEARRGWLYPLVDNPAARASFRPGEWNQVMVSARGERIMTWINGVPAADLFDAADAEGHIAFQVHGVGDRKEPLDVRFRNVRLRRLE